VDLSTERMCVDSIDLSLGTSRCHETTAVMIVRTDGTGIAITNVCGRPGAITLRCAQGRTPLRRRRSDFVPGVVLKKKPVSLLMLSV
jgi:hypothetical protein